MTVIIGIDPGQAGGIAIFNWEGNICHVLPMPVSGDLVDGRMIYDALRPYTDPTHLEWQPVAYIEKVSSRPGQGVASMFKFGKNVGIVMGVLWALGIAINEVTPQAWKKVVLAGTDKSKEAAIEYCRRVYPTISLIPQGKRVAHDGIADAICIADYGMREKL